MEMSGKVCTVCTPSHPPPHGYGAYSPPSSRATQAGSGSIQQHAVSQHTPAHPCTPLTCTKPRSAGVGGGAVPPEVAAWG